MADLPAPKAQRQSVMEYFDSFYNFDDDGQLVIEELTETQHKELEDYEKTLEESKTFRPGAASTHNKLDRHLIEYRKACAQRLRGQRVLDQETLKELVTSKFMTTQYDQELFFPADRKELFTLFNYYLTVMAATLKPRSNADDRPRLATVTSRRWSLLHWAKTYLDDPPSFRVLQARTNSALFYAVKRYGINTARRQKTYFSRHELRYLIDYDMSHTNMFDAAESHHLAWTIALITGVRPGAIGRTRFRKDAYLRWSDIQIFRNMDHPQRFNVTITFPYMKGFQDASALETAWNEEGYLRLSIQPPQSAENISLSPAYRLLAIALKRGILERYQTYQELLEGQEVNILVKNDHLGDAVFPALGARGLSLDFTKPATAASFTQYLKLRADTAGFRDVTMYSFRRKAAMNVDRAAGRSAVRMFMNHNPQSMTFEKSYEQANFDLDVAAIAYGEVPQEVGERETPVLYRAELVMKPEQLNVTVEKYIALHADMASPEYPLQRRRLRRQAMTALRQQALEIHRQQFTLTELRNRVKELKSSTAFMNMIRRRAQDLEAQKQADLHKGMTTEDAAAEDDELDEDFEDETESPVDVENMLQVTLDPSTEEQEESGEDNDDEDAPSHDPSSPQQAAYPRRPGPPPLRPETLKVNYMANVQTAAGFIRGNSQIFRTFDEESQREWMSMLQEYQDPKYESFGETYVKVRNLVQELNRQMTLGPPKRRGDIADLEQILQTDAPGDLEQILTAPYESTLAAFFDLMLEGQAHASGDSRQCPECLVDDTIDEDQRYKWWDNQTKLSRHQKGKVHAPYQKWLRKTKLAMDEHAEGKAACPVCPKDYKRYEDLANHLMRLVQNGAEEDDVHYALLMSEGFFSPNFNLSRRAESSHDKNLRAKDDVARGRKDKVDVPLSEPRAALLPNAPPPGYPATIVVGPVHYDPSLLQYPASFDDMPRLTPQSFRADMEARGLVGRFVNYVDPADPANPPGKEYKEHLEARGTAHLVEWGIPHQGGTKGKGKAGTPGQGEPVVRRL